MPIQNIDPKKAEEILSKFSKVQSIRQRSLEILVRADKKVSEYKMKLLKEKLEELQK